MSDNMDVDHPAPFSPAVSANMTDSLMDVDHPAPSSQAGLVSLPETEGDNQMESVEYELGDSESPPTLEGVMAELVKMEESGDLAVVAGFAEGDDIYAKAFKTYKMLERKFLLSLSKEELKQMKVDADKPLTAVEVACHTRFDVDIFLTMQGKEQKKMTLIHHPKDHTFPERLVSVALRPTLEFFDLLSAKHGLHLAEICRPVQINLSGKIDYTLYKGAYVLFHSRNGTTQDDVLGLISPSAQPDAPFTNIIGMDAFIEWRNAVGAYSGHPVQESPEHTDAVTITYVNATEQEELQTLFRHSHVCCVTGFRYHWTGGKIDVGKVIKHFEECETTLASVGVKLRLHWKGACPEDLVELDAHLEWQTDGRNKKPKGRGKKGKKGKKGKRGGKAEGSEEVSDAEESEEASEVDEEPKPSTKRKRPAAAAKKAPAGKKAKKE